MNESVVASLIDLVTLAALLVGLLGLVGVARGIYNAVLDRSYLVEHGINGDAAILVGGRIWRERLRLVSLVLVMGLAGMLLVGPMTLLTQLAGRLVLLAVMIAIVLSAVTDQRMRDALGRLYRRSES